MGTPAARPERAPADPVSAGRRQPAAGQRRGTGHPAEVAQGYLAGGHQGKLAARFAWVRVWPGHDWRRGGCAEADPVWLLVEEQADGTIKYALSNLPANTSCRNAVRLWKSRWPVEQGYQQLKEELGLDHFEGRSWRGFHHHAAMAFLAYGFLLLEKLAAPPAPPRRGKKGPAGDPAGRPAGAATPAGPAGPTGLCLLPDTVIAPSQRVSE